MIMKFTKTTIIYVPLMDTDYSHYFGPIDDVLVELCGLSKQLYVPLSENVSIPLKIDRPNDTDIKKSFTKREPKYSDKYLKFTTNYSIDKVSPDNLVNLLSEPEKLVVLATPITESYVKLLLIYLNLAKPGAFNSGEGVVIESFKYGDNEKEAARGTFPILANTIDQSLGLIEKYKWPPIELLSISVTLNWLSKHWAALNTMPNTRVERALNAFSYLFHDSLCDNSPSDLFFSLVGIEALFVEGKDSVQKQVDIKSQLLLGKRTNFKKIFNELYDFRSRYIHGQLRFMNKYVLRDGDDDVMEHMFNTYDHSYFAMLILISAIQKHISLDKGEFEFEYVMKE